MENGIKILSIAASILFFVTATALAYGMFRTGETAAKTQQDASMESMTEVVSPNWTKYAGKVITGSEVKYLIEKDAAFYRVVTRERLESFTTFSGVNDVTSNEYIDPADRFVCRSILNSSSMTAGLQFTETGTRNSKLVLDGELRSKLKTQLLTLQSQKKSMAGDIAMMEQQLSESDSGEEGGSVDAEMLTGYSTLLAKQSQLQEIEASIKSLQQECVSVQDKISEAVIGGE